MTEQSIREFESKFITPEHAHLLQTGLNFCGVEAIPRVREFSDFLRLAGGTNSEGRELPSRFESSARDLSKLVLKTEVDHVRGLIESGRIEELNNRINSEYGLVSKMSSLGFLID